MFQNDLPTSTCFITLKITKTNRDCFEDRHRKQTLDTNGLIRNRKKIEKKLTNIITKDTDQYKTNIARTKDTMLCVNYP